MTLQPPHPSLVMLSGQRVLRTEAEALLLLANHLPPDFEAAVRLIFAATGRVIVSGIGKSGHIGRKIAATLSSTGTPAYFLHGAEASHGDLGLIAADDVCILISNSGETAELRDVIAHTRRFKVPLVAISKRAESTLMQAADLRLLLPDAPEACPIGMAPTTSTTLTLALGDALAVALMELRGFKPEDFKVFHPGGKLGAQMMQVAALMHKRDSLPLVNVGASMSETLLEMTSKGFGVTAVEDGGRLVGVVSDGDLRRNMADLMTRTAGQVATRHPVTVRSDALAASALAIMNDRKINALVVMDGDDLPLGILHIHDCLRAGVA
ncbi:KpsF/GutQ family sugar-phosphate isomerase [Paracoccaceae bacterium Fryx2]|nr:KpsF/GutQ family sugar-phosphate isomerase [Paracoccaceae bacterium Fryx2]